MKITILNGNPEDGSPTFDTYLESVTRQLEAGMHSVTLHTLKDMDLKYCIGCFGCWVKHPGECVSFDDGAKIRQSIIESDLLIWASPLKMGYVSSLLKRSMDQLIPLLMPYFDPVNGELHHAGRYDRYPLTGLIYQAEDDTDTKDIEIVENLFSRTSLNFRSRLTFCVDDTTSVQDMALIVNQAASVKKQMPSIPKPTAGVRIHPPAHLTVFNGSPRGKKGNTPILLDKFAEGFSGNSNRTCEMYDLIHLSQQDQFVKAFQNASAVLLAFPLYTDSMPGSVKTFIESLEHFKGRINNPAIGFMVQSGFMESAHSRFVERYLEKLASRLGCPYLGTIVKGGVEGIQIQPENLTRGLFDQIRAIGRDFAENGQFNVELLRQLSKPERFPRAAGPLMKLLSKTRLLDFYWDMQLKNNQVFESRFARPYSQ
jgi:multimeric flavodoxin WrbA